MREPVLSVGDEELAAMGIEGLVEHCRAAGLRSFDELACRGTGAVIQVEVEAVLGGERLRSQVTARSARGGLRTLDLRMSQVRGSAGLAGMRLPHRLSRPYECGAMSS